VVEARTGTVATCTAPSLTTPPSVELTVRDGFLMMSSIEVSTRGVTLFSVWRACRTAHAC
jgi:hypothetical protein